MIETITVFRNIINRFRLKNCVSLCVNLTNLDRDKANFPKKKKNFFENVKIVQEPLFTRKKNHFK